MASVCGWWKLPGDGHDKFAGILGLKHVHFQASFTPAIEIGYRLLPSFWKRGIATEAGAAALRYGFEQLDLDEVIAYIVPANVRSRRVLEKLGLEYSQDFEHPELEQNHPMRRHLLYRLPRAKWAETNG